MHKAETPASARGTTPRTDAFRRSIEDMNDAAYIDHALIHARRLERELSSAQEQIAKHDTLIAAWKREEDAWIEREKSLMEQIAVLLDHQQKDDVEIEHLHGQIAALREDAIRWRTIRALSHNVVLDIQGAVMNIAELELDAVADAIEEAGYTVGALRIRQVLREFEKLTLELATTAADHEADKRSLNWCGEQLAACAEYLKEGEAVAECIARNRKDADEMLGALAKERRKLEALREAAAIHLSHYDAEGNRICTEEFMREVVKSSRAVLAATRKESEHG